MQQYVMNHLVLYYVICLEESGVIVGMGRQIESCIVENNVALTV